MKEQRNERSQKENEMATIQNNLKKLNNLKSVSTIDHKNIHNQRLTQLNSKSK